MADACLLTLSGQTDISLTPPGKLYGYMAAARAVVAAAEKVTKQAIDAYQCGLCVPPSDAVQLAECMTRLVEDPALARQLGQNGREHFMKHYTVETYVANLEQQLASLLEDGGMR